MAVDPRHAHHPRSGVVVGARSRGDSGRRRFCRRGRRRASERRSARRPDGIAIAQRGSRRGDRSRPAARPHHHRRALRTVPADGARRCIRSTATDRNRHRRARHPQDPAVLAGGDRLRRRAWSTRATRHRTPGPAAPRPGDLVPADGRATAAGATGSTSTSTSRPNWRNRGSTPRWPQAGHCAMPGPHPHSGYWPTPRATRPASARGRGVTEFDCAR